MGADRRAGQDQLNGFTSLRVGAPGQFLSVYDPSDGGLLEKVDPLVGPSERCGVGVELPEMARASRVNFASKKPFEAVEGPTMAGI